MKPIPLPKSKSTLPHKVTNARERFIFGRADAFHSGESKISRRRCSIEGSGFEGRKCDCNPLKPSLLLDCTQRGISSDLCHLSRGAPRATYISHTSPPNWCCYLSKWMRSEHESGAARRGRSFIKRCCIFIKEVGRRAPRAFASHFHAFYELFSWACYANASYAHTLAWLIVGTMRPRGMKFLHARPPRR